MSTFVRVILSDIKYVSLAETLQRRKAGALQTVKRNLQTNESEGTAFEKFDRLFRAVVAVPKSEVEKEETKERLKNRRKRAQKKAAKKR